MKINKWLLTPLLGTLIGFSVFAASNKTLTTLHHVGDC